ncbi:hypothetical protein [Carboxylicivirga sp. N1Y90]|uniref:hypothetical protein n=1 Tax=Carboxylicivirga fragile TaxID=3417571 RepID=UPI003D34E459|nr:hypothetical protein [Marinilabiliaceae bacterium N1Y90]
MTINKTSFVFLFIICFSFYFKGEAQNSVSSPYSIFGVGVLEPKSDATNAGMGHTGIALSSDGYINTLNPASLSGLDSTTFLFNIQGKASFSKFETQLESQHNFDANLDAFQMAFKVNRNWGMSFSLQPFSSIGYNIYSEKYILGTMSTYPVEYIGEGGISQVSWSNGIRIAKGFSLGLSASFLWGNTDVIENSYYPSITGETITNSRSYKVNSLLLEYGFQYHQPIGSSVLSFGARINTESQLHNSYEHNISNDNGVQLLESSDGGADLFLPCSYGFGVALQFRDAWLFTGDYRYGNWSESQLNIGAGEYKDTHGASLGIQFTPQKNYYRSYFNQIKYRAGVFYNQNYFAINGINLDEKGVTFGATLPVKASKINIAYEYKQSGTMEGGLIKENYHNIKVGFTFNETWFRKSKFQ